ncbi:MAG: phage major capsid protein [Bacteroidetes bacterium]|nr:phage major capsid protein [Bacteroidota bacterium]
MKTSFRIILGLATLLLVVMAAAFFAEGSALTSLALIVPAIIANIETSDEAKQLRAQTWDRMDLLIQKRKAEKRNFTDSETVEYDRLKSEFDHLTIKVKELEEDERRALEMAGKSFIAQYGGKNPETESQWIDRRTGKPVQVLERSHNFSDLHKKTNSGTLGKIIRGIVTGDWAGVEPETRAALSTTSTGTLVPVRLFPQVIDKSRAKSVVFGGGAQLVIMEGKELTLARVATDPTIEIKAENDAFSDNGMTFDGVELNSFTIGGLLKISNELLQDSPNAANAIDTAISAALAAELDRLSIWGQGTTEPKGIMNQVGVESVSMTDFSTDYITYRPVVSAWTKVANNSGTANLLALSPRDFAILQTQATDLGFVPKPELLKDVNFTHSTAFPTNQGVGENESSGIIGDFSQVVIGLRQSVTLEASSVSGEAFERNQTYIRVIWRGDIGLMKPGHFAKITGMKPDTA